MKIKIEIKNEKAKKKHILSSYMHEEDFEGLLYKFIGHEEKVYYGIIVQNGRGEWLDFFDGECVVALCIQDLIANTESWESSYFEFVRYIKFTEVNLTVSLGE